MIQQPNLDIIVELPLNLIVHDMAFDWTGKRLAAACSDKTIKIYNKKGQNWFEQTSLKIQGAAAWKVKWARPQFGTFIATCSLDRQIRIYELKMVDKSQNQKYEWTFVHNIQQSKSVEDIKFMPGKYNGLSLVIATSDGYLTVLSAKDPLKLKQWGKRSTINVNQLGLNCLSISKNLSKEDQCIIAVGCKNVETSLKKVLNGMKTYSTNVNSTTPILEEQQKIENSNTIIFVNYCRDEQAKPLQKIIVPKIKEMKSINDISWAMMNGRSYHILAVASDHFLKIFQLNIKDSKQNMLPVIDVLRQIKLSQNATMRISWNVMGTYLSSSEKKKVKIWRCLSRGIWNEIKEIQE